MDNLRFKSWMEAEKHLEERYKNKVASLRYFTQGGYKTFTGKIDQISIDVATQNPPIIIVIFNTGQRFEVDKDNFFNAVKLFN